MSKEENDNDFKSGGAPSATHASSLQGGYNQTYIILKNESNKDSKGESSVGSNEVFFRCGNWCYKGPIDFMSIDLSLGALPALIPCLQRQQPSLRYFCTSKR